MTTDWKTGDYAISMARVSDDVQTSIPDQHNMNTEGAAIVGLSIPTDGYFDEVVTRSTANRDSWVAAKSRMKDPHCVGLVVTWPSRAFGDLEQTMIAYRYLTRFGVHLFDPKGREEDVGSHVGRLIGAIKGWQSEGEVIETRRRVSETHRIKAKDGRLLSRPPFGVKVVPLISLPCKGNCIDTGRQCKVPHSQVSEKHDTVAIVDEAALPLLRRIFEWVASGKGLRELEERLQSDGIRSPLRVVTRGPRQGQSAGGTSYSAAQLHRMIRYRFYRGEMEWGRIAIKHDGPERWVERLPAKDLITRSHALGPLIPTELWDEANRWIDVRANAKELEAKYAEMLFDGLVFCARCGAKMSPARRSQKLRNGSRTEKFDYRCPGKAILLSKCRDRNHVIPEHWLLPLLGGEIAGIRMRDVTVTWSATEPVDNAQTVKALRAELTALTPQLENINQMTQVGMISVDEGVRRTAAVNRQASELDQRLAALLAPPAVEPTRGVPADLRDLAETLADESIPFLERKRSLISLIDRVVVDRPAVTFRTRQARLDRPEA